MDNDSKVGAFALGIVLTALLFLFLHRSRKGSSCGCKTNAQSKENGSGATGSVSFATCPCGGSVPSTSSILPTNPGVSIGGESFSGEGSFSSSSVVN